ncbi:MAG: hypothetical protein AMK72_05505, partial [Planctomycetes bacterium SM23_25]
MEDRNAELGPGNTFSMNDNSVINLIAARRLDIEVDPGGGTINSLTPGGPPIWVRVGQDGSPGLSDTLTINLDQGNLLRAYVQEVPGGTPQILNNVNALGHVAGRAEIEAERANNDTLDGFAYFRNVRLASGAILDLDRANSSTAADLTLEGLATVSNIGNGTTIFVADVTGTATGATLTVGGANDINLVGTITDAGIDVTNTATTYLLDMTP